MAKIERKSIDELLENAEVVINPDHVNDWHFCDSGYPFKKLQEFKPEITEKFNMIAAISAPKSIRYRQRDTDFEGGKRGDYLFVDRNGGRMSVPCKLFRLLWKQQN